MIVSIHQPECFPYPGFFAKMMASDGFVILDNVQFKKNNFQNRNRILTHGNPNWLTVPVATKGHMTSTIRDIKISSQVDWKSRILNLLYDSYHNHPYYDDLIKDIQSIVLISSDSLFEFNMAFINLVRDWLNIQTPIVYASDLPISSHKSDLVLDICNHLNVERYISGKGGIEYLDREKFLDSSIDLYCMYPRGKFVYPQSVIDFVPNLSIIDLLMNVGKESAIDYIHREYAIEPIEEVE